MKLTVLGCSGSVPGPESPASSYLLEADGRRILLDLGNGALGALLRYASMDDLDAVLLSHLHPDHCLDLCGLYVARRYGPGAQAERSRLAVWGPAGAAERMALAYGLPPEPGMTEEFDFHAYPDDVIEVGPFRVQTATVKHPVPAYAIRVEVHGRALAYSGDTGPTRALVDLASGADVFLCEAAFGAGEEHTPDMHLTGQEAGEHAKGAGVGRLVVTHVPPWGNPAAAVAGASEEFGGPVTAARSGQVLDV